MTTAKDIMHHPVVFIEGNKSVSEAAKLMAEKAIGCLIVTGERGVFLPVKELGMVTERDVLKRVVAKSIPPDKTTVSQITSKPLIAVEAETNVEDVSEIFEKRDIRRIAVTEGEMVVGIVTVRDVANSLRYSFIKSRKEKEYIRPGYGRPPIK
ncbi:MAG: CBS domain-containing protein [Candidatus Altiarchaeota archaeon]